MYPVGNYKLKVNNRNTRTRCEIFSKLTMKRPEWRHGRRSGIFIVKFEHISQLILEFLCAGKCRLFMYANRMFHTTELLKHVAACLKHKFKLQCPVLIQQSRYGHMKEVIRMKYFALKYYSKQIITQKKNFRTALKAINSKYH